MISASNAAARRWRQAQVAERQYWDNAVRDSAEFLRIINEKLWLVELVRRNAPEELEPDPRRPKDVVEIGIGPLGIGVGSFLQPAGAWRLLGVEPQPKREANLPRFLMAAYDAIREIPVTYVQAMGEATGLDSDSFDLALCYNVIDHTPNWRGILTEVRRLLKPGGIFVLSVDTVCLASRLRWNWWLRPFHPQHPNVLAHPYRFAASELERLLPEHGLANVWVQRDSHEWQKRILGRARRLTVIGRKPL